MSHRYATIEDTLYFGFVSNDTSGSGDDGATARCDVRLCGAAASDQPIFEPTPDLLTGNQYRAGNYEVAIAATVANGFAAGSEYLVFVHVTTDGQIPGACLGGFTLGPAPVDVVQVSGDATAADNLELDYDGTGYAKANSTIGTCTTNTDAITVAEVLTTAMTEAYNADGAAPTVAEALHLIIAYLTERSVSGTTVTAKQLDGSTSAATFTLDSATAPTSITRAS